VIDPIQATFYRVFVQGWTKRQLQEIFARYSSFPLKLDNYADTPGSEGYTTQFLSEVRFYAAWLQTMVDGESNHSEEIQVILSPNPDTTEELEMLERLEQEWYALVDRIEQAYKSSDKDGVMALYAESEHKREAWLRQASAFEILADMRLEVLRSAIPEESTDKQAYEVRREMEEQWARHETHVKNMQRLRLQATVLGTRIPTLKKAAEEVARTGRWPDYD